MAPAHSTTFLVSASWSVLKVSCLSIAAHILPRPVFFSMPIVQLIWFVCVQSLRLEDVAR